MTKAHFANSPVRWGVFESLDARSSSLAHSIDERLKTRTVTPGSVQRAGTTLQNRVKVKRRREILIN
jgi:hypothetical protein